MSNNIATRAYTRATQLLVPVSREEHQYAEPEEILFKASTHSSTVEYHVSGIGWQPWPHSGYQRLPGGNFFQINNAGHAVGLVQGFLFGCTFGAVAATILLRFFMQG